MQRGDPLRFEQSPYSAKRKGGTLYVLNTAHIKFGEMQRGDPLRFEQNPYSMKFSELQRGDPLRFEQIFF